MTVPELAQRAHTSTGATYRVVAFAEEEELVERRPRGPIVEVRWRRLLERWSRDYGFAQSNTVERFLEPRGLDALLACLRERPHLRYAVTGSLAAERRAAYAPARLATIYVENIAAAAQQLGLRSVETGTNVVSAAGDYDVTFERTDTVDGVRYAAASQVAVDLLTGRRWRLALHNATLDRPATRRGQSCMPWMPRAARPRPAARRVAIRALQAHGARHVLLHGAGRARRRLVNTKAGASP